MRFLESIFSFISPPKKGGFINRPCPNVSISVERGGEIVLLEAREIKAFTGAKFLPELDFEKAADREKIREKSLKIYKKGKMTREQLWLGAFYKKELLSPFIPDVFLRFTPIGWGVFAARDFKEREFIGEYGGVVRKRGRLDKKNAYCFEYILAPGEKSPYTVDASEQGGISRYLNHSFKPNLQSALATYDHVPHIIFYTKKPVSKGTELTYDYGENYWSNRASPKEIYSM